MPVTAPLLPELKGIPRYDDAALYLSIGDRTLPWEFNGWEPESLSWKTGCYIHAGLSGFQLDFTGPDVLDFWASISVNSFAKFPVGSMKHAVMCMEEGLIASHAILQRNDERELRLFAAGLPWAEYQAAQTKFQVEARPVAGYLHQVARPNSTGDTGACHGREPARHRFPTLPQGEDQRSDSGGRPYRHVRKSGLRGAWAAGRRTVGI